MSDLVGNHQSNQHSKDVQPTWLQDITCHANHGTATGCGAEKKTQVWQKFLIGHANLSLTHLRLVTNQTINSVVVATTTITWQFCDDETNTHVNYYRLGGRKQCLQACPMCNSTNKAILPWRDARLTCAITQCAHAQHGATWASASTSWEFTSSRLQDHLIPLLCILVCSQATGHQAPDVDVSVP